MTVFGNEVTFPQTKVPPPQEVTAEKNSSCFLRYKDRGLPLSGMNHRTETRI